MPPKLLKRKLVVKDEPILDDEYWQSWIKLGLSQFPTVKAIEKIPNRYFVSIDDIRFDELFDALLDNCPLAQIVVPYVIIYLRTRRAKLTTKDFIKEFGLPSHVFYYKNALIALKEILRNDPYLKDRLKIVYVGAIDASDKNGWEYKQQQIRSEDSE